MDRVGPRVTPQGKDLEHMNDEFVKAAERGDYAEVEKQLGLGAFINARCLPTGRFNSGAAEVSSTDRMSFEGKSHHRVREESSRTALQAASDGGHDTVVKLLIYAGAEVNAPPAMEHGRTALQAAAGGGYQDTVELLIDAGADVNAQPANRDGRTALQAAAGGGHEEIVRLLIDAGAKVDAPPGGYYGRTALQAAAGCGHQKIVGLLVEVGANVNATPGESSGRTALQAAAGGGYQEIVKVLIDAGAHINALPTDEDGRTALQAAVEGGHQEIAKLLIDAGANVNARSGDWKTALQAAAGGGHKETVKLLIGAGADVNAPPTHYPKRTALQAAAESGHQEIIQQLMAAGAEVNAPPAERYGRTALQAAAENGHQEIIQQLMAAGAEVNAAPAERYGKTAVQAAAGGGHQDIVKLLISAGSEVNAPSGDSKTALQAAAAGGHQETVKILMDAGADINARSGDWNTVLQAAAGGGHQEIVKLLINAGAHINDPPAGYDGRTALQAAAVGGHHETVRLLIDKGADINARSGDSKTALQAAAGGGHQETVKLLMDAGAKINDPPGESSGRTALQAAALGGHHDTMKLLIDKGADVNARSENWKTALHVAVEAGHQETVKVLVDAGANVNPAPEDWDTVPVLQVAAGGGYQEIVRLLIGARADVNAPPTESGGRTALQAAAEGGHREIVKMLMAAGADVNAAPPPEYHGKTALQAAAGGGHLGVVKLLIDAKADVNAPPAYHGKTALQAAAEHGHLGVVKLLIDTGVEVNAAPDGTSLLVDLARSGVRMDIIELLIDAPELDLTLRDRFGFTTLHQALWKYHRILHRKPIDKDEASRADNVEKLIFNLVESGPTRKSGIDTKDHSGKTPLETALEIKSLHILEKFLSSGADPTGCLRTEDLRDLLDSTTGKTVSNIGLRIGQAGKSHLITGNGELEWPVDDVHSYKVKLADPWINISLRRPDESATYASVVAPSSAGLILGSGGQLTENLIRFKWWLGKLESDSQFHSGVPKRASLTGVDSSEKHKIERGPMKAGVIGYVRFCVFLPNSRGENIDAQNGTSRGILQSFELKQEKVEISWIMAHPSETQLRLEYLSIPSHGVEFATLFLDDIHRRWVELLQGARLYLTEFRDIQLIKRGMDPIVIKYLLQDSQQWNKLRSSLKLHISKSQELWNTFKDHEALYMELAESESDSAKIGDFLNGHEKADIGELGVMVKLSRKITLIEECMAEIAELKAETKEMIELEFNLASIYQARKYVEMSEIQFKMSNDSDSMKRLSWITFVFLPLTFVSGLFGMNLDIFANNPSWTWYLVVTGTLLALILVVWTLFKYVGISDWIEENIGSRLKALLGGGRIKSTTENLKPVNPSESSFTRGSDLLGVSSSEEIPPKVSSLRRRLIPIRKKKILYDLEQGAMADDPKVEASGQRPRTRTRARFDI